MEKSRNLETGKLGEDIAGRYLQSKGYHIIERNYRTRYAEIDLIAEHKGVLVFVEVRTKKDERFGQPEESINKSKMSKLIRNANAYMARKTARCFASCSLAEMYRIDAVCIILEQNKKPSRISHYENIAA